MYSYKVYILRIEGGNLLTNLMIPERETQIEHLVVKVVEAKTSRHFQGRRPFLAERTQTTTQEKECLALRTISTFAELMAN